VFSELHGQLASLERHA